MGKNAMQEQMDSVPVRTPLLTACVFPFLLHCCQLVHFQLNVQRVWQEGCSSRAEQDLVAGCRCLLGVDKMKVNGGACGSVD